MRLLNEARQRGVGGLEHSRMRLAVAFLIVAAVGLSAGVICSLWERKASPKAASDELHVEVDNNPESLAAPTGATVDATAEVLVREIGDSLASEAVASVDDALSPAQHRVHKQIAMLRHETLEASLANLFDMELFKWPGSGCDSTEFLDAPLLPETGWYEVHTVMSNRRVLKVLDEIQHLPPSDAANLINSETAASLRQYDAILRAYLQEHRQKFAPESNTDGIGFVGGNNPDGSPTLLGIRWKVLSLVFVAGQMGVAEAGEAVRAVAEYAVAQRTEFYDERRYNAGAGLMLLVNASLYNRQILAAALCDTADESSAVRALFEARKTEWAEEDLAAWDASATPYDLRVRFVETQVDYSNGRRRVRYLRKVSDEFFDEILRTVQGL